MFGFIKEWLSKDANGLSYFHIVYPHICILIVRKFLGNINAYVF